MYCTGGGRKYRRFEYFEECVNWVAIKGRRLETFFAYDPGYCWHRMMRITGQVRAYCLKDKVKRGGNWLIGTTSTLNSIEEIVFDGEHLLNWTSESGPLCLSHVQEKNINGKRFGLFLFLLDVYSINMIGCINAPQG